MSEPPDGNGASGANDASGARVLFPLFLDVTGRRVLVVGGGTIAGRKALDFVAARADVHVVAPEVSAELEGAAVTVERRAFEERDIAGAWLVIAATDDAVVQRRIAVACE